MKPKIYENIIDCWKDLTSELDLKELPDDLSMQERMVFMVGVVAGERRGKGLWNFPEDTERDPYETSH